MDPVYTQRIKEAGKALDELLDTQINEIIETAVAPEGSENSLSIHIPSGEDVDLSQEELASLVAISANNYQKACRLAGIANAMLKRAEGKYKRKFKSSLGAKAGNAHQRESIAMESAAAEHEELVIIESVAELANYQEQAARVASESTRKLLDKVSNIRKAEKRQEHGFLREGDFD